jgi:hypothetical protein
MPRAPSLVVLEEDETVKNGFANFFQLPITGLKPGVNEILNSRTFEPKPLWFLKAEAQPQALC